MEKVLVLLGGDSSEREVSLRSGANVATWLRQAGYDVREADPASPTFHLETLITDCDVVLPMLHGAGGEDGTLQCQLEARGMPFLGSESHACALTFDKQAYRKFVTAQGIQMAEGQLVNREQFNDVSLRRSPYVLKPTDGGSSVDTVILHDLSEEPNDDFFDALFSRHETMLMEQLIQGQEFTVGVLGQEALPVILVVPPAGEEFDYENKYNGRTQELVNPTQVARKLQQAAQDLALQLHSITGCRHLSRSDMIATPDGTLYVLETNTIPGMTEQSLFPKMAAEKGINMEKLVGRFVQMAKPV